MKPVLLHHYDSIATLIDSSSPSDHIYLNNDVCRKMRRWWDPNNTKNYIPADILIFDTVPIKDCVLFYKERPEYRFRIVIFNKRLFYRNGDCTCGSIVWRFRKNDVIILPIIIHPKSSDHIIEPAGFYVYDQGIVDRFGADLPDISDEILNCGSRVLGDWYAIQISLLNPLTKEIFANPKIERVFDPTAKKNKKNRRITKYVKKHYITRNDLDQITKVNDHNYKRSTLAWYVIGHIRHYKNGTKKFIQGYWKGPLREFKRNFDTRERIIDEEPEL